jgi:hypothetical protein
MTTNRITVRVGDHITDIIAIEDVGPAPRWTYTDVDGDKAAMFTAKIPGVGAGIYLRASADGCSIAAEDVEDFITAIRATVAAAIEAVENDD